MQMPKLERLAVAVKDILTNLKADINDSLFYTQDNKVLLNPAILYQKIVKRLAQYSCTINDVIANPEFLQQFHQHEMLKRIITYHKAETMPDDTYTEIAHKIFKHRYAFWKIAEEIKNDKNIPTPIAFTMVLRNYCVQHGVRLSNVMDNSQAKIYFEKSERLLMAKRIYLLLRTYKELHQYQEIDFDKMQIREVEKLVKKQSQSGKRILVTSAGIMVGDVEKLYSQLQDVMRQTPPDTRNLNVEKEHFDITLVLKCWNDNTLLKPYYDKLYILEGEQAPAASLGAEHDTLSPRTPRSPAAARKESPPQPTRVSPKRSSVTAAVGSPAHSSPRPAKK